MGRSRWKKLIKIGWWSGWWVGECFFWYRFIWVVPEKGPYAIVVVVVYHTTSFYYLRQGGYVIVVVCYPTIWRILSLLCVCLFFLYVRFSAAEKDSSMKLCVLVRLSTTIQDQLLPFWWTLACGESWRGHYFWDVRIDALEPSGGSRQGSVGNQNWVPWLGGEFVCLSVSNFGQKLPNGFAWDFQGRLAMGQWTND